MKILLIAPSSAEHSRRFLDMLLDAGHSVWYVDRNNPKPDGAERFTYLDYPRNLWLKWRFPRKVFLSLVTIFSLRKIWTQVNPDVTHVIDIDKRAVRCALAGIHPLVLTSFGSDINDLYESQDTKSKEWRNISRALKKASVVTSDSKEILKRCEIIAGCPLEARLFYFGIDLNLFYNRNEIEKSILRRELGIPDGVKVILSPRRLSTLMRHDLILESFNQVIRYNKYNHIDTVLLFRIFGGYQYFVESQIKDRVKQLDLERKVIWVPEFDYSRIPVLYSLADLIINFPDRDGFPVTLFEAAACKTPIITSKLASYSEIIDVGKFFTVTAGDVNQLTVTIGKIISNQFDTTESVQINHELVHSIGSSKQSLKKILEIYEYSKKSSIDELTK